MQLHRMPPGDCLAAWLVTLFLLVEPRNNVASYGKELKNRSIAKKNAILAIFIAMLRASEGVARPSGPSDFEGCVNCRTEPR